MASYKIDYTPADIMICAMARLIKDGETAFHGVASHMPLLAILLAKQLHAPNAVHLNIPGGVDPDIVKLSAYSSAGGELLKGAQSMFPLIDVFDLSMRGGLDVAFLSGVQFDMHANLNASVIGDYDLPKVRMPGGAGCAVLIPTAKRALVWRTKHDTRTFVEKVDFVTTRGNIDSIITPLCVFRQRGGMLELHTIHPYSSFDEVQANTGFALLRNASGTTAPPTPEEMRTLNSLDPDHLREIEFV